MKEEQRKYIKVLCKIAIVIFILAAIALVYIMATGGGQVEGVECGPGQYYYTDIPNWRDYFLVDYYDNKTPMIVLLALFFGWGYIMFKVWQWLDDKFKE